MQESLLVTFFCCFGGIVLGKYWSNVLVRYAALTGLALLALITIGKWVVQWIRANKKSALDHFGGFIDRALKKGKKLEKKMSRQEIDRWIGKVGDGIVHSFSYGGNTKATWDQAYGSIPRDAANDKYILEKCMEYLKRKKESLKNGLIELRDFRPEFNPKFMRKLP